MAEVFMIRNDSKFSRVRAVLVTRYVPLALSGACTASLATPGAQTTAFQTAATSRATSITATDLRSVNATTTLDAVRQLRPDFLRASPRSDGSAAGPAVYVDGMLVGDISSLSLIQIAEVRGIIFLHPVEARFQFGATCPCGGGIVSVRTSQDKP
jgi:hypothetical protein